MRLDESACQFMAMMCPEADRVRFMLNGKPGVCVVLRKPGDSLESIVSAEVTAIAERQLGAGSLSEVGPFQYEWQL